MNYLRFDWERLAGFFSKFLDTDYDSLVELFGEAELTRQFRTAATRNKQVILNDYPRAIRETLFDETRALKEFAFTERLYDELCAFLNDYTAERIRLFRKNGIRPLSAKETDQPALKRFLASEFYDCTIIEIMHSEDAVRMQVDTYGGFTTLTFSGVTLFELDGNPVFNEYRSDELFRLPDCLEFNLQLADGGLRIHFTDFNLEREYTDAPESLLLSEIGR